ncbi:unnamed protein product [Dibothriocephalus latus]|uniref:Uncharacterized protein n=1 Tax=Dibothriocephalus latus TaxID=60516 RepID=A0A3P6UIH8_DIBLA|nr:unnamed protein product [Dibothriocephalus latus]
MLDKRETTRPYVAHFYGPSTLAATETKPASADPDSIWLPYPDIFLVLSSMWSLLKVSWAASNLWFEVPIYTSLLPSNFFMLTGRLMAISTFAASAGLLPLLCVLLFQACVAVLTEVALSWGHTERSKPSKENVVARLLETASLLFDAPMSITFRLGPARIGCYCI